MARYKKNGLNKLRTRYWYDRLFVASKKQNNKQLSEFFSGVDSNATSQWKDYQDGVKIPSIYLSLVEQKLGVSEQDFIDGPRKLFAIMETSRLNDAIKIASEELDSFNCDNDLPLLAESTEVYENFIERTKWLIGRGKKLFDLRKTIKNGDGIIPIALAFGHIEARMLGISDSMKDYIIESLMYFEKKYGIPSHAWNFDVDICYSVKCSLAHHKLTSVFETGQNLTEMDDKPNKLKPFLDFEKKFFCEDSNADSEDIRAITANELGSLINQFELLEVASRYDVEGE
jgi:hypothetical protein